MFLVKPVVVVVVIGWWWWWWWWWWCGSESVTLRHDIYKYCHLLFVCVCVGVCVYVCVCVCVCVCCTWLLSQHFSTDRSYFMPFLFFCDFIWMRLETLHHVSDLRDNFWFNAIWPSQSVATLTFYRNLSESDITVTPSVTRMVWLH
jgi:hypothetical protein